MKTALITGATSGIGAAAARRFVTGGWRVIATGRREDRLDALAQELGDALHPLAFDMRDEAAREAAVAGLPDGWAPDLLVNNAGLALGTASAQSAKLSDWATMIETNIVAVVALTHRLLPGLIERRGRSSTSRRWRRPTRTPAATCMAAPRRSSDNSRWG